VGLICFWGFTILPELVLAVEDNPGYFTNLYQERGVNPGFAKFDIDRLLLKSIFVIDKNIT